MYERLNLRVHSSYIPILESLSKGKLKNFPYSSPPPGLGRPVNIPLNTCSEAKKVDIVIKLVSILMD